MDEEQRPTAGRGVSIKAVAARAGVGIGSVSRVLSGKGPVSPAMLRRVQEAVDSLGYRPNLLAQSLRSRATRTVGFVISDITNPLLASIVGGAETVLSAAGYAVLLTNSGGRREVDAQRIRLLLQRQVDGLIVLPASEDDPDTVEALAGAGVPVVAIDRDLRGVPRASFVLSDHRAGIGPAVHHLLARGHRRIALIAGPDMRPGRERQQAFLETHKEEGATPFASEFGPLSALRGREVVGRLLERGATAFVLGGNQLLEGALEAAQARKIDLGRTVAFVCCDDVPLGRLSQPPTATVMRDTEGLGRAAAHALLARIAGGPPDVNLLPTWFEPRDGRSEVKGAPHSSSRPDRGRASPARARPTRR